jgi:sporulation protein YlmC with PRC-barrel domain
MDEATTPGLDSHSLISSRMVEGTPVFDVAGEKLGKVHSVMIDKATGQVAYAVLAFGGLLHMDKHVHPIPWEKLTYDRGRGGYIVDVPREVLDQAPFLTLDQADRPTRRPSKSGSMTIIATAIS